ncbi:MAG: M28 family peptidase [Actinomycetota bacterium]|nr:M28 family peptidase [Actinomycetota bacterium]
MPAPAPDPHASPLPSEATLRDVVYTLAAIRRPPCSPGEREAAEWLAERFREAGLDEVALEEEPSWGTWPPNLTALAGLSVLGASLTLRGRRVTGGALSALAALGIFDEVLNGPRVFRRALRKERRTTNVVAQAGDADAPHTLVVLAHHDAAQTGFLFDQTAVRKFHETFPEVIPKIKTQPPQWWAAFASPLLGVLGALSGRRGQARASLAFSLGGVAVIGDIWRSETVPGANDNLSACAVLVALAEMLRESPRPIRVWLVSAGAEETLQDGIRAFMERHGSDLDRDATSFLCIDTVGSPRLVMLEGEGPGWMEDYDPGLRDTVARVAEENGLALERGFRARASTDAIIPQRHGYRIANLCSVNDYHNLSNYHLPTDTAENVNYGTVAEAAKVTYALAAELAATHRE